ncbi:MAG: hypothetical protein JXR80_02770 [Deltaproteobacteria bacterium]|nr:hypothetical protein [Deltaproteobacteria bacterium]
MPRGDGSGPPAGGRNRRGQGGGPLAAGPEGWCVCPQCGAKLAHVVGQPCNQRDCPQCGAKMTRE